MRLVLLGPPGAGKGTQAALLAARTGVPKIATGDLLRGEVDRGTSLGRQAREYMAQGVLVPDSLIVDMVRAHLPRTPGGFILDGFPRNLDQAAALEAMTPLDLVVALDVPQDEVIARFAGRRECAQCHTAYHVEFRPPQREGVCDVCGGALFQREDDRPEVVTERLETYAAETAPLIAHYRDRALLETVSGSGSVEAVAQRIEEVLADHELL